MCWMAWVLLARADVRSDLQWSCLELPSQSHLSFFARSDTELSQCIEKISRHSVLKEDRFVNQVRRVEPNAASKSPLGNLLTACNVSVVVVVTDQACFNGGRRSGPGAPGFFIFSPRGAGVPRKRPRRGRGRVPCGGTLLACRFSAREGAVYMQETAPGVRTHDPLAADLTPAGASIQLDDWDRNIPPRRPIVPHIRIGKRWINVLWALPIAGAALIVMIAVAQNLREIPEVQAFLQRYPGVPQGQPAVVGFPGWLRIQHFLNMFFMYFIMRAGIQILADHPRLYWNRDCTPGTEWLRFSHPVPAYRMWTAKDDAVTLPGWLGIPGLRHSIGLARWWHFSVNMLWTINGVTFFVLLFLTDQWMRLVPLTWDVFPNALSTAIKYASLNFPPPEPASRFNSLQQLTYFFTFFIAAPIQIAMGLLQGPAFSNRLGWLGRVLNRQVARSIHVFGLSWFVFFIIVHGVFVFITGLRQNTNHMFAGVESPHWVGLPFFLLAFAVIVAAWLWATPFTIKHARLVQKTGRFLIGGLKWLVER